MKLILLLCLITIPAWAKTQKIQETTLPNGLKVHEYRLDNGLQLLLVPDASAPVFTFQAWFNVGSATEKLDPKLNRTGLAHLFEHMMFRGTPKNPDQVFDAKISEAGAVGNNATTWLDRTNYFESLPKEQLELILDLESDRMVNLALNEKLFKTELGAVFGELKMNEDKPTRLANRLLSEIAYDQHPYKWSTMGTPEELNSFTVADAQYFYKTYYAPNNATVILIGDISIPQALKLTEKYYGKIPSQKIPSREAIIDPEITKPRKKEASHPLANTEMLLMGFRIPNMNHKDTAALEVLAAILGYGDGSVLEKQLVQAGISSSMYANAQKLKYPALFTIGTQLAPGKSHSQASKVVHQELKNIKEGKISEEELERAKNQFLLLSYSELLDNSGIGENLGESLISSGNYLRGFQIFEEVKHVKLQDVQRVTQTYLDFEKECQVLITPGANARGAK